MTSIFNPEATATIQAQPPIVFELLCDRLSWKDWNPFIPRADLLTPATDDPSHLQVGQRLKFFVQIEFRGKPYALPVRSVEEVVELTTPNPADVDGAVWRVSWEQRMLPAFVLRTVRVNEIYVDPENNNACVYRTYMSFDGPLAWLIKLTAGAMVQHGLERWARGLKAAAERPRDG